ncbi:helix-turn-helix domain-containing protein [Methylobacterium indicum]|uniref:helix-turn-helix domain-containing protein n=1 Tax=Methylobacterium indicum TaxID=1775910 RepID=UPI001FCD679E|nr:helix-turn-helix transcriptional regulator [Methylobacterium indicum]
MTDEPFDQNAGIYPIATVGNQQSRVAFHAAPRHAGRPASREMAGKPADHRDVHIGSLIEERRLRAGLSREALAAPLGVSLSQLGKYLKGANRLSATDLDVVARIIGVPVGFFFEDMPGRDLPSPGFGDRPQARLEIQAGWTDFAQAVARAADAHLDEERRQTLGSLVRAVDQALSGQQSFDKANDSGPSD